MPIVASAKGTTSSASQNDGMSNAPKAPSMWSAPWAKFTTRNIPKMTARPRATRAKKLPPTRPLKTFCSIYM